MITRHGSLGRIVLLSLATALTTWATLFSWRGFSDQPATYLVPLLMTCLSIGALGALLRWVRTPALLIPLAQLLLAGVVVLVAFGGSPLPTPETLRQLDATFAESIDAANKYAAPVPFSAGSLQAPLVTLGMICAILVDFIACTLRRVPLAGLPLLTIYSVPVSLLDGVGWPVFVLAAGGFMAMLFLQEDTELLRWGWALDHDSADPTGFGVRTGRNRTTAFKVGATATALGVVLPFLIPTLSLSIFDGSGSGPGDGTVRLDNPMTDLRRDLLSRDDRPLLQVETDDPTPTYLRYGVLVNFNGEQWQPGGRDLSGAIEARGDIPAPFGVSDDLPRESYDYSVEVTDQFESTWLPVQVPLTRIQAGDNWRYDEVTQDLVSSDEDDTTRGLDYTFSSQRLEYDQEELLGASTVVPTQLQAYTDLPTGLPDEVRDLTTEVTEDYGTRYEKAVALQDYFRSEFEYSLSQRPGVGDDALLSFLEDKSGYCEQFAGMMAVMARMIDVPSRVAVGFLNPERTGNSQYTYSTDDLHAWVELYFPGSGWVLFDPTPSARVPDTPAYTQNLPEQTQPSELPTAQQSTEPSDRATGRIDEPTEEPSTAVAAESQDSDSFPWLPVAAGGGGAVLVLLLLMLPRWWRRSRRDRRWRDPGGAEAAWLELRDTVVDHQLGWPSGLSPRETGRRLAAWFAAPAPPGQTQRPARGPGVNPEAEAALIRVVMAVERDRYAPNDDSADSASLRADAEVCAAAIAAGATPRVRRRARWWPASVTTRRGRRTPRPGMPGDVDSEARTEELVS